MDWDKGFSATYYLTIVDPESWRDTGRTEIIEGSISRTDDSLYQNADVSCVDYDPGKEQWVRIYLEEKQSGDGGRQALFTGLATSPEVEINGTLVKYPLECYSVLKPAEDILLQRGWYAPADVPGTLIIRQLLSVCPCPLDLADNAPKLTEAIIAEDGETNLSMVQKILMAINWRIRITGDGTVHVLPVADDPIALFDTLSSDIIQPEIQVSNDWFECPNVFRAVSDGLSGVARDDDPNSLLSTVTRGREVWMEETDCDFADGETIGDYALRRLKEEQSYYLTASYTRRYHPDVYPTDLIRLHYPGQGLDGVFKVTSQNITLGYGAETSEEVSN